MPDNSQHTATITALAHGGDGIARIDGQVCFIAQGLPGDVVRIRITHRARGVLWGKIITIETPSPDRAAPVCPNFGRCGACLWDHFAYPAQGKWKQQLVADALQRHGGYDGEVGWREDPALRRGYRTRAEFHGDGKRIGFFGHGTHDIADTEFCPLCHPKLNAALAALRATGWRRDATLTVNPDGDDILLWGRAFTPEVTAKFPQLDMPRERRPPHQFSFDGIPIVNGCFSQSSLLLNRLLHTAVREALQAQGPLLDLYCGSGNLSLPHRETRDIIGMDQSRAATAAAAAAGGDYRAGGEDDMSALIGAQTWGSIVLDPPRAGAKALVPALIHAKTDEIIYAGCDPVTLGRDLRGLQTGGWKVANAVAIDLFPHTAHVETVCRLVR